MSWSFIGQHADADWPSVTEQRADFNLGTWDLAAIREGSHPPPSSGPVPVYLKSFPRIPDCPKLPSADDWPKLASFDWPPPPSPPAVKGPTSAACYPGLASLLSKAKPCAEALEEDPEEEEPIEEPTVDVKQNRALLWSLREQKQRAMFSRPVLPYPFGGQWLRFEDKFSALQICPDGRFSYSRITFEGKEPELFSPEEREALEHEVINYEGYLLSPSESCFSPLGKDLEPNPAQIEAHAFVRYEIRSDSGRPLLSFVRQITERFEITVSPLFQIASASVEPMSLASDKKRDRRVSRRKKLLPLVSLNKEEPCRRIDIRRRVPKRLKFTSSTPSPIWQPPSEVELEAMARSSTRLPQLSTSKSAPTLQAYSTLSMAGKKELESATTDWKEYYKQRANTMMAALPEEDSPMKRKETLNVRLPSVRKQATLS